MKDYSIRQRVLGGIAASAILCGAATGIQHGNTTIRAEEQTLPPPAIKTLRESGSDRRTPLAWLHEVSDGRVSNFKTMAKQKDLKKPLSQHPQTKITIEAQMPKNIRGPLINERILIYVSLDGAEWEKKPVDKIAVGGAIEYRLLSGAIALGFVAGDAIAAIQIEDELAGRICLKLSTKSSSDFLWALGFRRSTTITEIHPKITTNDSCSEFWNS